MNYRDECKCPCHSGAGIMHIKPCCQPRPMQDETWPETKRGWRRLKLAWYRYRLAKIDAKRIDYECKILDLGGELEEPMSLWRFTDAK